MKLFASRDQLEMTELHAVIDQIADQQRLLTDFQVEFVQMLQHMRARTEAERSGQAGGAAMLVEDAERLPLADELQVHLFPDYSVTNPYQALIRAAMPDDGCISAGTIDQALAALKAEKGRRKHVFHLHWTNTILGNTADRMAAEAMADAFIVKLEAFRNLGGVVVWTIHNTLSHEHRHPDLEKTLLSRIAATADRIHLHSPGALAIVSREYPLPAEKVVILPHPNYVGVYQNFASEATARTRLRIAEGETVFAFIGMLRPYKGIDQLLESFRLIRRQNPRARLIIAGEPMPPYGRGTVQQMVAGADGVLVIERRLQDGELQWLFNASDFVVTPYHRVLTSGSVLNALSFARPVIVPDIGVLPETVGDGVNGLVYASGDAAGLTEAMQRALEMPGEARSAMRQRALDSVRGLTWRRLAEGLYGGLA